jgi:hypothetical protein
MIDDIYLKETFKKGLRTKVKMAIIGIPRRTLAEMVELTIVVEKEMPIRRRNMAKYCQDFNSDEFDESDEDERIKPKRKGAKV